jgi:SNF2 family DNA or RNA helicase
VHHGSERLEGKEFQGAVKGVHLVVTTYALALRDREQLGEVGWRRIVIDEAQAIKNAATKQARAVRSLAAPRRIALTGTPVENRLADLWSIMEFANPGLLGTAEQFKDRFARPIERGNEGADAAAERLRQATSAFVLRRVKTDPNIISDLPDKVEMPVVCNLTSEQASLYQAEVDRMLAAVQASKEGIAKKGIVLAGLTRLKQICDHPALFLKDGSRLPGRSGKLARVEDLCDEVLTAGEKALLFTQYAEFGAMLQRTCRALRPAGRLPARRHPAHHPRRPGTPLRGARRPAAFRAFFESGRRGTQPYGRESRVTCRQVVESGGGEPGHRPRVPHRPAEERAGQQADVRGHAGGADRPGDRGEEGTGREGSSAPGRAG